MTEYFTLAKVDEEPKEGPSCWIRDKTLSRVDIGPVINHLDTMPGAETREIIVLIAIVATSMFKTREKRSSPRGPPCWTPNSDVTDPMK